MLRSLYLLLLRLHPSAFRLRFSEEMLDIFEKATSSGAAFVLLVDASVSVVRQWMFRSEFRQTILANAASGESVDVSLFRMIEPYRLRPGMMLKGAFLAILLFGAIVGTIGRGAIARNFLIGVHRPSPHLLPLDRASFAEGELSTTVKIPTRENPLDAPASAYFEIVRVLKSLDANRDLVISPWEIITAPGALRRLDSVHDGKLNAEECGFSVGNSSGIGLETGQRIRREFMRGNPVLGALDADRDGQISAAEIADSAAALKNLDQNRDGSLTPEELLPEQSASQASLIVIKMDSNGDETISREEVEGGPLAFRDLLLAADRDHDGTITRAELEKELRLRMARKKQLERALHGGLKQIPCPNKPNCTQITVSSTPALYEWLYN